MSGFFAMIGNFLPQILLGTAAVSLILLSVMAIVNGLGPKRKLADSSKKKTTQPDIKAILKALWLQLLIWLKNTFDTRKRKPLYFTFQEFTSWVRNNTYIKDPIYSLPWYLAVSDCELEKSDLFRELPLEKPHGYDVQIADDDLSPSINWWLYNQGVVIDIDASLFMDSAQQTKDKKLSSLLSNLNLFRPKRPLDGIILFLPCHYFQGPTSLTPKEIQEKSEHVAAQLRKIEKHTGLKLPVYIVLTGCDEVAGFDGVSQSIPANKVQQILGWSSDYVSDAEFDSSWIKTGFESLLNALNRLSFNIFLSQKTPSDYLDDNLIFAPSLMNLQNGLTDYLKNLFSQYNLTTHYFFRGFYITGTHETKEQEDKVSIFNKARKVPLFMAELFKSKIFAEYNIATPIDQFLISSNRRINIYKSLTIIFIVVASLGLYLSHKQLRQDLVPIISDTTKIHQTMQEIKSYEEANIKTNVNRAAEFFQDSAPHVLNLIEKIRTNRLRYFSIPVSWFSSLPVKLDKISIISFDQIITRSMYLEMIIRSHNIIERNIPALRLKDNRSTITHPLSTPEYLVLQGYVDALYSLEQNVSNYNNLNTSPDVQSFSTLINYLYNFFYSQSFLQQNSDFIFSLLQRIDLKKFDLSRYKMNSEERFYNLTMNFAQRVLDPLKNYQLAIDLQKAIQQVDEDYSDVPTLDDLRKIKTMTTDLIRVFNGQQVNWLAHSEFNPGYAYDEMYSKARNIQLFSTQFLQKVKLDLNVLYQLSRENLKNFGTPITGYFFTINPSTTEIHASDSLITFSRNLEAFLDQPFMQPTSHTDYITTVSDDKLLYWDSDAIEIALDLTRNYKEYVDKKLDKFTLDLNESLKLLAKRSLHKNISNIMYRAQKEVDLRTLSLQTSIEANILSQIDNIAKVGPKLVKLLVELENVGEIEPYMKLRLLVQQQLTQALKQLDKLLKSHNYYPLSTDQLAWWQGNEGLALQSHDVSEKELLKTIFVKSTENLTRFATTYSKPIVELLNNAIFVLDVPDMALLEKWATLNNDLVDYQKKKAGNSIMNLENFILKDSNTITFTNCFSKVNRKDIERETSSYFKSIQRKIENNIYNRCKVHAAKTAIEDYRTLSAYFNNNLAGKFPFSNTINDQTVANNEVSDQEIKNFFTLFDNISPQELSTMNKNKLYNNMDEALQFLGQVAEVKEFLNTYFIPQKQSDAPGLDFDVEFRANESNEVFGQLVINWGLVVGSTTLERKSGSVKGRWQYGDVTAFAFRWASDAALQPMRTYNVYPAYITTNNRAIYIYQGPWSLLRAMMLNQANAKSGAMPGDNSLLEFNVPLSRISNASSPDATARLFVKIKPKALKPNQNQSFKIPKFPYYAPVVVKKS
ncbi:MAG: hypothetical protein CMM87_00840 [Rickettsiales bacterium]|nr:hypothetical protein [Rickettsiales bacterium]|tara:strand:- start:18146 stop:22252 length:4107 start_codon:yes stop_codon:yes gene_type:complete